MSAQADEALKASFPMALAAYPDGARILAGQVSQMADTETDWAMMPALRDTARKRGFRSLLWTPLLREGAAIGMISVTRREPGSLPSSM